MLTVLLSTILLSDTVTTEKAQNLDEVVIVSETGRGRKRSAKGQVASIDEHLGELKNVNLVRRGSYAWEPVVNNMQTERLSTTIDGMKIFYACTDKMDPVTSYVESGNLQSISLNSGLDGNPQATGNIGGSLDLKLRKAGFDNDAFHASASVGHEWNGHVQVYGADAALSSHRTYLNAGAFFRHADNYKVGGGDELQFSQFQKVNVFTNAGLRLAEKDMLEATFIFDRATDVGYPALNMDVAKAEGLITSLSYKHLFRKASWETKAYYNHITHEMDDTKRPDVAIHMDMPGKSWTAGVYSLLTTSLKQHDLALNYDLYYNRLFADMTMYPGGAAPMYMVTWPDVGTLNTGVALTDNVRIARNQSLRLSAKVAWQQQRLNNEEGYHALKVFFPGMTDAYHQTTGRIAANYNFLIFKFLNCSIGAGWGSRAPTVTEAYGYYLNNTFDQYDYIGNPSLKNESAVELNGALKCSMHNAQCTIGIEGNVFLFSNYIIGQFETRLSPMTVGAEGVKVYGNISHATIANASLTAEWQLTEQLRWNGKVGYSSGRDADGDPLPLISPVSWQTELQYHYKRLQVGAVVKGNARQSNYGEKYGETAAKAWTILNLAAQNQLSIVNYQLSIRVGVENLFDKQYATYADWNHIPQKGRNIYMNLTFEL
ncbi:MAG: TonB-dependent receptor [Prevotella sp.]|nr:TonB-dependent receptor [Prevotella sp.]